MFLNLIRAAMLDLNSRRPGQLNRSPSFRCPKNMRTFLKYAAISVAAQVFLCIVLGLASHLSSTLDSLFESLLQIYNPVIVTVLKLGNFHGESSMMAAIWLGIPAGTLVYGIILGGAISILKKNMRN